MTQQRGRATMSTGWRPTKIMATVALARPSRAVNRLRSGSGLRARAARPAGYAAVGESYPQPATSEELEARARGTAQARGERGRRDRRRRGRRTSTPTPTRARSPSSSRRSRDTASGSTTRRTAPIWVPAESEVGTDFVPYTTAGHWTTPTTRAGSGCPTTRGAGHRSTTAAGCTCTITAGHGFRAARTRARGSCGARAPATTTSAGRPPVPIGTGTTATPSAGRSATRPTTRTATTTISTARASADMSCAATILAHASTSRARVRTWPRELGGGAVARRGSPRGGGRVAATPTVGGAVRWADRREPACRAAPRRARHPQRPRRAASPAITPASHARTRSRAPAPPSRRALLRR